jgi:hypothetical protein
MKYAKRRLNGFTAGPAARLDRPAALHGGGRGIQARWLRGQALGRRAAQGGMLTQGVPPRGVPWDPFAPS